MEQFIRLELPRVSVDTPPSSQVDRFVQRKHPVQQAVDTNDNMEHRRKYFSLANVYGNHMPIHFEMQNYLVSAPLRLPTLRSSNVAMEILNNTDEDLGFEDWLNDPSNDTKMLDLHARMENRLGLHAVLPKN